MNSLFHETRRKRKLSSLVVLLSAICEGAVAVAILFNRHTLFAGVVGGVMLVGAIIVIASGIVLWRTAARLPE
jgi:hypothetical protein